MPLSFILHRNRRISLIVKDHVIRCVDVKNRDLNSVRFIGERYLPDGLIREGKILDMDTLEMILEECVQEWGIKNSEVQFLVPDSIVVVRKLQIPEDVLDMEVRGYFYLEIGASIHLPFENPVFDYEILGVQNHKKEVLFYAAPEQMVEEYVELLERTKLKPIAADISSLAIYRLYHHLGAALPEDHLMCIQFDLLSVNIGIFKDYKLVFMRHIKMNLDIAGWSRVREESGEEILRWSGDVQYLLGEIQNMVDEINRVMNFYRYSLHQGKEQITRILVAGDHPDLPVIDQRLKDVMGVPVDSLTGVHFDTVKGERISTRFSDGLGLALKEVP